MHHPRPVLSVNFLQHSSSPLDTHVWPMATSSFYRSFSPMMGSSLRMMGRFASFAAPSSHSGILWEGLRTMWISVLFDVCERLLRWFWARYKFPFTVSATFTQGDPAYEWLLLFLADHSVWQGKSRDVDISARRVQQGTETRQLIHPYFTLSGVVDCIPTSEQLHSFFWRGYRAEVEYIKPEEVRYIDTDDQQPSKIRLVLYTRQMSVLQDLIREARTTHAAKVSESVNVRLVKTNRMGGLEWSAAKSKKPRPVESLILGDGAAENILEDVQAFLDSESWFISKGIPFRRGYLLHGPPGTGKTSTIFTLVCDAGALKLEVYILSLWGPRMNDVTLQELVSAIPKYAIVVIEDIDCIFPPGGDRGDFGSLDPHGLPLEENHIRESRVTLSGLLNVLDGVGSDEGRVLFGTTNRLEALDPALTRPGRFDIKVEYKLASSSQAKALFERFFSGTPESSVSSGSDGEGTPGPDSKFHRDYLCMAVDFASAIPDQTFSMAELQGYLLTYHLDPRQAVRDIRMWIEKELLERDRLEKLRKARRQTNFDVHFHPADSPSPAYLRVHDGDAMSSTAFSSTGSNGDLGQLEQ